MGCAASSAIAPISSNTVLALSNTGNTVKSKQQQHQSNSSSVPLTIDRLLLPAAKDGFHWDSTGECLSSGSGSGSGIGLTSASAANTTRITVFSNNSDDNNRLLTSSITGCGDKPIIQLKHFKSHSSRGSLFIQAQSQCQSQSKLVDNLSTGGGGNNGLTINTGKSDNNNNKIQLKGYQSHSQSQCQAFNNNNPHSHPSINPYQTYHYNPANNNNPSSLTQSQPQLNSGLLSAAAYASGSTISTSSIPLSIQSALQSQCSNWIEFGLLSNNTNNTTDTDNDPDNDPDTDTGDELNYNTNTNIGKSTNINSEIASPTESTNIEVHLLRTDSLHNKTLTTIPSQQSLSTQSQSQSHLHSRKGSLTNNTISIDSLATFIDPSITTTNNTSVIILPPAIGLLPPIKQKTLFTAKSTINTAAAAIATTGPILSSKPVLAPLKLKTIPKSASVNSGFPSNSNNNNNNNNSNNNQSLIQPLILPPAQPPIQLPSNNSISIRSISHPLIPQIRHRTVFALSFDELAAESKFRSDYNSLMGISTKILYNQIDELHHNPAVIINESFQTWINEPSGPRLYTRAVNKK